MQLNSRTGGSAALWEAGVLTCMDCAAISLVGAKSRAAENLATASSPPSFPPDKPTCRDWESLERTAYVEWRAAHPDKVPDAAASFVDLPAAGATAAAMTPHANNAASSHTGNAAAPVADTEHAASEHTEPKSEVHEEAHADPSSAGDAACPPQWRLYLAPGPPRAAV